MIHPVTVGRCNPLAVTPAKISLHVGYICSHLVPSHQEEVLKEDRAGRRTAHGGPGPCAFPVIPIPQEPQEPGLGRGLQPGVRIWRAGHFLSSESLFSLLPHCATHCFEFSFSFFVIYFYLFICLAAPELGVGGGDGS